MKTKLGSTLVLSVVLLGCDHKAATPSNLESGLNHYLSRLEPCPNFTVSNFPITVPAAQTRADMEALTEVGLLTKSAAAPAAQGTPQVQYDLTDDGKKSAFSGNNPIRSGPPLLFCFGRMRVNKIVNFTEPADQDGVHMTHVTYTVELTDVPSWAKNANVDKAFANFSPARFKSAPPRDEVMALTHEGWRRAGDQ